MAPLKLCTLFINDDFTSSKVLKCFLFKQVSTQWNYLFLHMSLRSMLTTCQITYSDELMELIFLLATNILRVNNKFPISLFIFPFFFFWFKVFSHNTDIVFFHLRIDLLTSAHKNTWGFITLLWVIGVEELVQIKILSWYLFLACLVQQIQHPMKACVTCLHTSNWAIWIVGRTWS